MLTQVPRRRGLGRARPPAVALMGLVVVLGFVLVTGVTAALTVPAVALSAEKTIPQMLPLNTALYVSADVNPGTGTRTNLATLANDYTSQPGWKAFARSFDSDAHGPQGQSCLNKSASKATDHLPYLGHDTSIALITAPGNSRVGAVSGSWQSLLAENLVLLAPLDVRMTLFDAVAGFAFSAPKESHRYRGISIYRETLPDCGLNRHLVPAAYYAAVYKGYIIAALIPGPIERIIDVASGIHPALATNTTYANLTMQLPGNQLGAYYVNPRLLRGHSNLLRRMSATHLLPGAVTFALRHATMQAGAVTSFAGGLQISDARLSGTSTDTATLPVAGSLATTLPDTTQAYASTNGLRDSIISAINTLRGKAIASEPASAAQQILTNVRGEIDFVVLGPRDQLPVIDRAPATRLSAALYWRTRGSAKMSRAVMSKIVRGMGENHPLRLGTQGGITYGIASNGSGYAVGRGWAMISNSLFRAIATLESKPHHPLIGQPAYGALTSPGTVNHAIWYLDVAGRKQMVWQLIRVLTPARLRHYEPDVHLILGPIQGISGSVRQDPKSGVAITTITVAIPANTP